MNTSTSPPPSICFNSEVQADDDDCSEITDPLENRHSRHTSAHKGGRNKFMTSEQQETLEFIQQLAKQQEMIKLLETKLSQCQLEKEALEIENAVFTVERSLSNTPLLGDQNAKLVKENAKLQVVSGFMHKSYKELSQDARRKSESDEQIINTLEQENKVLREKVQVLEASVRKVQRRCFSVEIPFTSKKLLKEQKRLSHQDPPKCKVQQRDAKFTKSINTASTCLLDESHRSLYTNQEDAELPIDMPKASTQESPYTIESLSAHSETVNDDGIIDIDAQELKEVVPWLQWTVKPKLSS